MRRLAFHGLMVQALKPEELRALKIYKHKLKEGQVLAPAGAL